MARLITFIQFQLLSEPTKFFVVEQLHQPCAVAKFFQQLGLTSAELIEQLVQQLK